MAQGTAASLRPAWTKYKTVLKQEEEEEKEREQEKEQQEEAVVVNWIDWSGKTIPVNKTKITSGTQNLTREMFMQTTKPLPSICPQLSEQMGSMQNQATKCLQRLPTLPKQIQGALVEKKSNAR